MKGFLPIENYIKKVEVEYGTGLLISLSEDKARFLSQRKKNVSSAEQWLETEIPDESKFINITKKISEHSSFVLEGLKNENFLLTLFISEARQILLSNMEKQSYEEQMQDFAEKKYNEIIKLSGIELIQFVNERCRTHNMGKSCALLYEANIKGSFIPNGEDTDFLIFNPHKDLQNIIPKKKVVR